MRGCYIENWGRGIEKIVDACDLLGAPRPEYEVLGYSITLHLHALESAVISDRKGSDVPKGSEEYQRVPKSSDALELFTSESERRAYDYLLNTGPSRTADIARSIGLSPRGALKVLRKLVEKGLVRVQGSTSSRLYTAVGVD